MLRDIDEGCDDAHECLIVFSMGTLGHPIRSQRHNSSTVKKSLLQRFLRTATEHLTAQLQIRCLSQLNEESGHEAGRAERGKVQGMARAHVRPHKHSPPFKAIHGRSLVATLKSL